MIDHELMLSHVRSHPYPLVFATISGAHLYGFPSPNSDFDIRGTHLLPLRDVVGLTASEETVEKEGIYDGLEIDLVTHDICKFFRMMLRPNGYVLEQIFSPIIVFTTPEHEELKSLASPCVTKHHAHHYLGFAASQWKLVLKESPPRVKPLLYLFRVLLTGIYLMQSGRIESNLVILNETEKLPFLGDLISQKLAGPEKGKVHNADIAFFEREYLRLTGKLQAAYAASELPDVPSSVAALNDLLVRLRLKQIATNQ